MEKWTWIDIIVISVLIFTGSFGFFRGLAVALFGIIGIVAGFFIAKNNGHYFAALLVEFFGESYLSVVLGYLLLFLAVFILFGLVGRFFRQLLIFAKIRGYDRLGGVLLGIVKGSLYSTFFIFLLSATPVTSAAVWEKSHTVPYVGFFIRQVIRLPFFEPYQEWLEFDEESRPRVSSGKLLAIYRPPGSDLLPPLERPPPAEETAVTATVQPPPPSEQTTVTATVQPPQE